MAPASVVERSSVRSSQIASLGPAISAGQLSIALPKGRLFQPSLDVLAEAGLSFPEMNELQRRLVCTTTDGGVRFIIVRPADVPVYVEHGAADLGITGKDVLLEGDWSVCELLDLGFGTCRMVVAAPEPRAVAATATDSGHTLRAATKFPNIARRHFAVRRDLCVQIIKLNGAVEIAPASGLADVIVDIVDTGRTLAANGLAVVEEITQVSARLVANRASLQLKHAAIRQITSALRGRCDQEVLI